MSWIAEYDTQGKEFPTCVHVTKTTGTMTHGATYVPIEDGKAVRAENAKLRELVARLIRHIENPPCESCMAEMSCAGGEGLTNCDEYQFMVSDARELGVEV